MRLMTLSLLFLMACKSPPPAPEDPVWGKQTCALCAGELSEPRPSAQAVADGKRVYFDDVGCLAEWMQQSGEKPEAAWVQGTDGEVWIDAFTAHYSGGHETPKHYGFLSAADGLNFREVRLVVREKPKAKH